LFQGCQFGEGKYRPSSSPNVLVKCICCLCIDALSLCTLLNKWELRKSFCQHRMLYFLMGRMRGPAIEEDRYFIVDVIWLLCCSFTGWLLNWNIKTSVFHTSRKVSII
jgi:hypothetical protein